MVVQSPSSKRSNSTNSADTGEIGGEAQLDILNAVARGRNTSHDGQGDGGDLDQVLAGVEYGMEEPEHDQVGSLQPFDNRTGPLSSDNFVVSDRPFTMRGR